MTAAIDPQRGTGRTTRMLWLAFSMDGTVLVILHSARFAQDCKHRVMEWVAEIGLDAKVGLDWIQVDTLRLTFGTPTMRVESYGNVRIYEDHHVAEVRVR